MKQKIYEVRIRYTDAGDGKNIVVKRLGISSVYRYTSARADRLSHETVGKPHNNWSLQLHPRAIVTFRDPRK